jgi:hypothetical protein
MMLKAFALLGAVAFTALYASPAAQAAVVSSQGGEVLIGKGDGFVPLAGAAEVAPGARVMVQQGGVATITYAGTCTVRVGPGFWLVQQASPCAEGTTQIDFTTRMNQQAPPGQQVDDIDPLVIGGLIVGGGVALSCLAWWCQSDNNPASP